MTANVTLVSSVQLRPGTEDAYRSLHEAGVGAARASGGLVDAQLIPAVAGVQEKTVGLLTFSDRAALDLWLTSSSRAAVLSRMATLATTDRQLNVLRGFPGWFVGTQSAPRWKQAPLVALGLIPVALVNTWLRIQIAPDLAWPTSVAAISLANVVVLTWGVMPVLNRVFANWLRAHNR